MPAKIVDHTTGTAENAALGTCDYAPIAGVSNEQHVTLLIRPEHIRLSRNTIEERKNVRIQVDIIVNHGDNALVVGRVGDLPMRVRALGADVVIQEGEEMHQLVA